LIIGNLDLGDLTRPDELLPPLAGGGPCAPVIQIPQHAQHFRVGRWNLETSSSYVKPGVFTARQALHGVCSGIPGRVLDAKSLRSSMPCSSRQHPALQSQQAAHASQTPQCSWLLLHASCTRPPPWASRPRKSAFVSSRTQISAAGYHPREP